MVASARNRVTPRGAIVAVPGRGAWMGNRGRLHDGPQSRRTRDIVRDWQSTTWITCRLEFRDRRVAQWSPNHYTPLFFLDEAVAFAAGHRPCAECRRADYNAYRAAWAGSRSGAAPYAREMDAHLHAERTGAKPHPLPWATLPDGVFVATEHGPAVTVGDHLAVFDEPSYCYRLRLPRPAAGGAPVLTPPSNIAVLRAGYPVQIDPGALGAPG